METPDLSTLSDNIDSTDDLVPSLQVPIRIRISVYLKAIIECFVISSCKLCF